MPPALGFFQNVAIAGMGDPTVRETRMPWSGAVAEDFTEETNSGVEITPEGALALTACYAAINVIATDLACLPIKMYKRRRSGGRDRILDDPRSDLLGMSPDGETTAMAWRQAKMAHVLTRGGGFSEIVFDGAGRPASIHLMDPCTTLARRRPSDGSVYYRHSRGALPSYRVLHFRGLGFDGLSGYSPIALAREAVALGLAAEAFGAAFFGNGSTPLGVIEHPGVLGEVGQKNLRDSWERVHRGATKAHRPAILEEGAKWSPLAIPPDQAQFIATRAFQVIEVARIYRLPPHKLGDYSQSHLANIEASNLDYFMTTLMPWCESIEQELNWKLLTRAERAEGYYLEHDMRAFLRGDMKTRAEYHAKMVAIGLENPDEARDVENMNPIAPPAAERPGSNHFLPTNLATLDRMIAGGSFTVST